MLNVTHDFPFTMLRKGKNKLPCFLIFFSNVGRHIKIVLFDTEIYSKSLQLLCD